jgi:hypothetical protein
MNFENVIQKIAETDIFARGQNGEFQTGVFIGRPFYLDYDRTHILVADAWKHRAKGIPQGSFLLAYYDNEEYEIRDCREPQEKGQANGEHDQARQKTR